jgi:hypothetical protein
MIAAQTEAEPMRKLVESKVVLLLLNAGVWHSFSHGQQTHGTPRKRRVAMRALCRWSRRSCGLRLVLENVLVAV